MKIVHWVCGIFSVLMLLVFLGKYAVTIGSFPLWIIIVGCLILPFVDLIKFMKELNGGN
ncbi:MAG: hypothetical protein OER43_05770 [Gammaproteobacteria bacterium]|nr:hypothetical protein [Gammaproteobacteria bacterium]MDH3413499.1 hypothetical protein [Gammaproteobacteria bacterium]